MITNRSNVTFLSNDSELYDLQRTVSTGVLIRLTSNELTDTFALPQLNFDEVPNNILLYSNETKLFIPSCKYICLYVCMYVCMYTCIHMYA